MLTADDLRFTPPCLPPDVYAPFLKSHWGIEGEFKRLSGERDQNLRVRTAGGEQYVYKIASPLEDPGLAHFQIGALLRIESRDPEIPVPRVMRSHGGNVTETLIGPGGEAYVVRLLSYVPGVPLLNFGEPSLDTVARIGALQGRMCAALAGMEHEAAAHFMPWDILNGLVVSESLRNDYLPDGLDRLCAPYLERLVRHSLPSMLQLPHQIIHNDAHAGNIMVDPDDPARVTGVIDFGDLVRRPLVVDLSTSLVSLIERVSSPLAASAALVRGFQSYQPISDAQLELLYDALVARAILTVQLMQFRLAHTDADPSIREVDLPNSKIGLERVLGIDEDEFLDAILAGQGLTGTGD